jgi:hypothetical protein
MITIQPMNFPAFLEKKFLEWQNKIGERKTVSEFARWLGVKQSSLSTWWSTDTVPSGESVRMLADKLGIEVYDTLGLPRPDENLFYVQKEWDALAAEEQRAIRDLVADYRNKDESKRAHKKRTPARS